MSTENNIDVQEVEGAEVQQFSVGTKRTETQMSSTSTLPPKRRKKIAQGANVWEHFSVEEEDSGKSNSRSCGADDSQKVLSGDSSGNLTAVKYDSEVFRRSVNEMIVINELPFSFVESEGFRRFCENVVPLYKLVSEREAARDIVAMYLQEKASLKKLFSVDKKRVSLTTNIWVSPNTSCSYMAITANWIDANWNFQKRIISFKLITDHKGDTIARQLIECLEEWGIEKVFTITMDNSKGNDEALRLFKNALREKGNDALVLDGAFMHMRCCAHIVNLIVRDGMADVNDSVVAIRNAVKYVRSSFTGLKSFELHARTGKAPKDSLPLDCITQWNSTYLMLTAALKLRVVFEKMLDEEKLYGDYFLEVEEDGKKRAGPPTSADWDNVQRLVKFLKIFFNCNLAFSASNSVTSSISYGEIATIEMNLIRLSKNNIDQELKNQAASIKEKFEKYWDGLPNMNELVIVASVFDPRNKMKYASLCFEKLYGKDSVESGQLRESVSNVMHKLYEEYNMRLKKTSQSDSAENKSEQVDSEQSSGMFEYYNGYENMESLYDQMVREMRNEENYSELEIYLMEKVENIGDYSLDYDVLSWWKHNSSKYPILSEVVRDVLAIQVSSVAPEFAFSTSGSILDSYRSSLTPYMIEALICTQQWLRVSYQSKAPVANLVQMLE